MKRIFLAFSTLLYTLCNADSVELVPFQQPAWYTAVSNNSDAGIYQQYTNAVHSGTESSHNITISTRSKAHHYHAPTYQQDVRSMNTEQLIQYFAYHQYTEDDILSRQDLFLSADYLAFTKKLPKYAEYVTWHYNEYRKFNRYTKVVGWFCGFYTLGFQDTFTRLYREYEEQRCAQEALEQKQREIRAQREREVRVCKEAEEHAAYIRELERVERMLSDGSPCKRISMDNYKKRLEKIQVAQQNPERKLRRLQTGQDGIDFAKERGITEEQITHAMLNSYEYQLHTEFLTHIRSACALQEKYSIDNQNIFIDALGSGIELGIKSNYLHNPEWATRWSDFCYEAIDIIQGIGAGIVLGSYNTVDMVMHPVRTLVRMVDGVRMLGSLTARTVGTLAHLNWLIERGEYLQFATEVSAIGEQLGTLAMSLKEHTSQMSNRDIAKHVTAFGTEWVLTGQMFIMGHTLCSNMGQLIQRTIRFLKEESKVGEFLLATVDGVLVKASENINKVGGGVGNIVRNGRTILESLHTAYMAHLEIELQVLRSFFDNKIKGFAEFTKKYIKIEYKHILGIEELPWKRDGYLGIIDGFHHDFMDAFKRSSIVEFVDQVIYEHGFSKATILYEGNIVKYKGTFFPADWSRKKVIEKICEAYENFLKSGVLPREEKGKYVIEGFINEGIKIRMYITKNGVLKTAYPLLE